MRVCSVLECNKKSDSHGLCQMHNWRRKVHGSEYYQPWIPRKCSIDGCDNRHKGHGLCVLHLNRKHIGLPMNYEKRLLQSKRYRQLTKPEHPLADIRGRVYEHRMVLYDSIGNSVIPCFWCAKPLSWESDKICSALFVDHIDHDRHNNILTNLVPTCNNCNAGRTYNNPRIRSSIYSTVTEKVGT